MEKNNLKTPKPLKLSIISLKREIKCLVKIFDIVEYKPLKNSIISGFFSIMLIINFLSISLFAIHFFINNQEASLKAIKLSNNDGCYLYCGATQFCSFDQSKYKNKDCDYRNNNSIILKNGEMIEIFKEDCIWDIMIVNSDSIESKIETLGFINPSDYKYIEKKDEGLENLIMIIKSNYTDDIDINFFANLEYLKLQFVSFTKNRDLTSQSSEIKESWSISTWKIFEKYEECKDYIKEGDYDVTCGAFQINFNDNMFIINFDSAIMVVEMIVFIFFVVKIYKILIIINMKMNHFQSILKSQSTCE